MKKKRKELSKLTADEGATQALEYLDLTANNFTLAFAPVELFMASQGANRAPYCTTSSLLAAAAAVRARCPRHVSCCKAAETPRGHLPEAL